MPFLCTLWINVARNFRKIRKCVRKITLKENKNTYFFISNVSLLTDRNLNLLLDLVFSAPFLHTVQTSLRPIAYVTACAFHYHLHRYASMWRKIFWENYISFSKKPKHIAHHTTRHCKVVVQTYCRSSYLFNLYITTECHT